MNFPDLMEGALMVVVLLFSVIIHEVAHAYTAWLNGDPTPRVMGRITLNPLPHIDPLGTVLLPLLLLLTGAGIIFGWAKPVLINSRNFRNLRWGQLTVSAAGPLSNLLLATFFASLLRLNPTNPGLALMALWGCKINIFLALFNLMPIPPLDGSHLVAAFLPAPMARLYSYLEPVGFVLILLLFYSGIMSVILMPIYRQIAHLLLGT